MQLIEGNQKNKDPLPYFTDPRYFPFQLMKENDVVERKLCASWLMLFTCENHSPLVQTQPMDLIEGNQKNKDLLLYFMGPRYLPSQLMKIKGSKRKKIMCKLDYGFHM